jgi:hypothetical protein
LQRQAGGEEPLDDGVVEIAGDPFAVLDQRIALDTGLEPHVLDGHAGGRSQADRQLLVDRTELACSHLVGEIEVAEDLAANEDRHPEERLHRRVVRWEPVAVGMGVQIREAQRLGVDDEQTEDAVALGELADAVVGRVIHPDRDELRQAGSGVVEHAESAIAGVDQTDGRFHDPSQHGGGVEIRAEDQHRIEQLPETLRSGGLRHGRTLRGRPGVQPALTRAHWGQ